MIQKATNTILTGKKLKMVEMLAGPDFNGTITELCEECGVARSTYYDWMEDSAFIDSVNVLINKYTDSELSRVWKALFKQIDKGDTTAIKLYFELKGKYKQNIVVEHDPLDDTLKYLSERWGKHEQ